MKLKSIFSKIYTIFLLAIFMLLSNNLESYAQEIFNLDQLDRCNTAAKFNKLTADEKLVIQCMNLVRAYPKQFSFLYIESRIEDWKDNPNTKSLVEELHAMSPMGLFYPNETMQASAACFALESGTLGLVGHDRRKCPYDYWAECCEYGSNRPIDILLSLLIDEGVPSLGHRKIILYGEYQDVGVSIQTHKKWRNCTVIDFK